MWVHAGHPWRDDAFLVNINWWSILTILTLNLLKYIVNSAKHDNEKKANALTVSTI
jgi:hypothetical protein